jgi:hypothetical protein
VQSHDNWPYDTDRGPGALPRACSRRLQRCERSERELEADVVLRDERHEHDILTGSNADGTLMRGATCGDWTSAAADVAAQVGHSDGLGAGGSTAGTNASWNSAHASGSCANTAPRGGAGRFYCFAQ